MSVLSVWIRLSIVGTSYEINQADRTIRNLNNQKEKTEVELAQIRSPRKLEELGKIKFGLDRPKPEQVIHIQ
jgi:hypothetical protein